MFSLPFNDYNPKDLDPSYKTDLDFWDCLGREKLCLITEEMWYLSQIKNMYGSGSSVKNMRIG